MESKAFREKKWKILYRYFDVKRDDSLEYDEYMTFPKRLMQQGKKEHGELLKSVYDTAWGHLCDLNNIPRDSQSLLEAQFVNGCEALRTTDWFVSTFIPTIANIYFDSLDRNHDGYISLDEWRVYQNNREMKDERMIQATFDRLDRDGDGQISREEMTYAVTQFNLGGDPSEDYSFLYDVKYFKV